MKQRNPRRRHLPADGARVVDVRRHEPFQTGSNSARPPSRKPRTARSEAGLEAEDLERIPVAPLLETTVEFFDPVAGERGIGLEVDALPDAAVPGDAEWLCQMFSNLLDNAIKYCSAGDRIRLAARVCQPWLVTSVSDTGPGIAPEDLRGIFDRFQRGSRHRNRPGFGLGLPIAQEIARAHGGRIEAESRPGTGTTFTVWLPLAPGSGS